MEAPSFLLARASELTAALRMLITEGAKTIYVSDSGADYVLLVWRVRGDLASSHGVSVVLRPSGVFVAFSILSSSGQPPLLTSEVRIGSLTTEMAALAQAIHRFGEAELSALNLPARGVDWSRFSTQFARNRHELIERMQAEKEQATAALTSQPDFSAGKLTDPSNGRPATAASVEAPELRDGLTVNDLRQVVRIAQAISSAEAEQMTVAEDEEGRPTLVWQLSNIYGFNARVVFVRRKQHMITTTTITSSTEKTIYRNTGQLAISAQPSPKRIARVVLGFGISQYTALRRHANQRRLGSVIELLDFHTGNLLEALQIWDEKQDTGDLPARRH